MSTAQQYWANLTDDWRKSIWHALKHLIMQHSDQIKEPINYKMLHYAIDEPTFCHINAQQNYATSRYSM